MAQVIKPKRSETTNSVPQTSDLQTHEIAMNVADKRIYTKKADGTVVILASHVDGALTTDDLVAFSIALG
ncbi:hypothetical protein N8774_00575 [Gammaproteobacteria bacterium]|nr:hypothetical protein [Gammaproteobacteria bacterium]